jgi:molybdenum cofactor cytidylyltransferase
VIGGLILAAGEGSRFGGSKQLAELEGRPLIEHAIEAMISVPAIRPVVVALGANADEVAASAGLDEVSVVKVEGWKEGIAASLRAGVNRLRECDAIVITLGDQPFVTSAMIESVMAFESEIGVGAARATFGGAPGHPVLVKRNLFSTILELSGDDGARDALEAAGCRHIECGEIARGLDVDTAEDLEQAQRMARPSLKGAT